jgi:acetate kinase
VRILVVNSGSSSLKLRLIDDHDDVAAQADLPAVGDGSDNDVRDAILRLGSFDAVGHRVVHGGRRYTEPTRIDGLVRRDLEALAPLAPLHQPATLKAIDIVTAMAPLAPAVACFDTAFHASLAPKAATYAVPRRWRHEFGVRKYGFHGLAHAWTSRKALQLLGPTAAPAKIVSCHLGAGASLAAVVDGSCVDTTMGFTPLDGLVMATRSGSIDPGLVLWLQLHAGLTAQEISDELEHQSGILGLADTADMRALIERTDDDASLAVDVYVHRLLSGISAMAAAAGGLDALLFSGGVGEHAALVRQRVASGLRFLDVTIDDDSNTTAIPDCEITGSGRVRMFIIAAREELEIAHAVRATVGEERSR